MTAPLAHAGGIPEMLSMVVPAGAFWLFYRLTRGKREQQESKGEAPAGTDPQDAEPARRARGSGG